MNGILAFLQQAASVLHAKGAGLWQVLSAIAGNRPLPARDVIVYTVAFVALLLVAPKIIRKVSK